MAKATRKRRRTKELVVPIPDVPRSTHPSTASPRWRILPPEIIHIILKLLKDDMSTLRACSLAARDFSQPVLSLIGRHLTLNHVPRIRLCLQILITNSAFQHVRSLDLGLISNGTNPKDYLEEQLTILGIFAQRQTLTRLWLSRFPFPSVESSQRAKIRDTVAAFCSTVSDLGLYGCIFPSYADMISLIRAFPHCNSLYIRDCVTDGENAAGSVFSELQEHKPSLNVLELTCASSNGSTIDVSTLIEDACLDVSQLSALTCCLKSTEEARSIAVSVSASPIQHLQLGCTESGGFKAFFGPAAKAVSLESFTIGPLSRKTDRSFWQDAFHGFQRVPRLNELTVVYHNSKAHTFYDCWAYFNDFLCRDDLFPRLAQVDLRITIRSEFWWQDQRFSLNWPLKELRRRRTVTLWGDR